MLITREVYANALVEALLGWLENPTNINRWLKAATLFEELKPYYKKPTYSRPYSVRSLGIHLGFNSDRLYKLFGMEKRVLRGEMLYRFTHKNNPTETI